MVLGKVGEMRGSPRMVRVAAPGKINVSLRVGPPRADGYHGIASVFLAVSMYEVVTATRTQGQDVTVSITSAGPFDIPVDSVPLDDTNLAVRAARLLAEVSPGSTGVHLDILKSVPVSGGMGGGSADAAAALLACEALWGSGFSRDELARIAAELGADVPFALLGGTAVGLGVGERLTPAISKTPLHFVLVPADYGLSTPVVYRLLDGIRQRKGVEPPAPEIDPSILGAMRAGDGAGLAPLLHNDLQEAALELAPGLRDILDVGQKAGALAGIVSGSGPTMAFLASSEVHATDLESRLTAAGLIAMAVSGPAHGARIRSDSSA
ncbi:4-(cytidine 5'-diphospho)-2-C-methyl-D-erythritol kinase [Arthrobacter sp. Br18]|uniref:4-(cytidine 5'-diphospho)-2-C-methyl-D-erythritol kinase n=1 Tax=Arthrobacter sp. Br18 TaxID=1312954 RepID=UPI00047A0912|nr:4-(cytidine 5'-diphospho)-2-C-methyl-D-erythritol kinase [Arthrobacter sp. Br18]